MPNFRVAFERSFELVIQAESQDELNEVLGELTDYEIGELDDCGEWDTTVWATTQEADQGILDGDIVHIDDMPTAEEVEEKLTEEEKWRRDYAVGNPLQMAIPQEWVPA